MEESAKNTSERISSSDVILTFTIPSFSEITVISPAPLTPLSAESIVSDDDDESEEENEEEEYTPLFTSDVETNNKKGDEN